MSQEDGENSIQEIPRRIPNQYKPTKGTAIAAFLAFMVMSFVSYSAVRSANKGQDNARADAQLARIAASNAEAQLTRVQNQLNCTLAITMKSLEGSLENSIAQDDMLIASFEGGERTAFVARLKEARERLRLLSQSVADTQNLCTTS